MSDNLNGIDAAIEQAMQRGDFDNLPGKGKPLRLDVYFETPEDLRVAYSVLKNAGFMPEEAELLKEIGVLKEKLAVAPDEMARKRLQREINNQQLKYDLLIERLRKAR